MKPKSQMKPELKPANCRDMKSAPLLLAAIMAVTCPLTNAQADQAAKKKVLSDREVMESLQAEVPNTFDEQSLEQLLRHLAGEAGVELVIPKPHPCLKGNVFSHGRDNSTVAELFQTFLHGTPYTLKAADGKLILHDTNPQAIGGPVKPGQAEVVLVGDYQGSEEFEGFGPNSTIFSFKITQVLRLAKGKGVGNGEFIELAKRAMKPGQHHKFQWYLYPDDDRRAKACRDHLLEDLKPGRRYIIAIRACGNLSTSPGDDAASFGTSHDFQAVVIEHKGQSLDDIDREFNTRCPEPLPEPVLPDMLQDPIEPGASH